MTKNLKMEKTSIHVNIAAGLMLFAIFVVGHYGYNEKGMVLFYGSLACWFLIIIPALMFLFFRSQA